MYCKYCGSRIASDATKCISCGADIDLNDGGQSFFDDNELKAWQNESVKTSVPKTEMIEPALPNASVETRKTSSPPVNAVRIEQPYQQTNPEAERGLFPSASAERMEQPYRQTNPETGQELFPLASIEKRNTRLRRKTEKKKNISDLLNLSNSNKLIIFCIASALAVVLLVVAIIAVLNSGKDGSESNGEQTNNSTEVNSESVADDANNAVTQDGEEKEEIQDIKIFINDEEISHPVSAYMSGDKIYISIDKVLAAEGYKYVKTDDNENRIRYKNEKASKAIETEKGTNKIWITENNEEADTEYLDGANFNEGSDTYVAAKSFFNLLGYSGVEYDASTKTLSINK